jgi:tetratricopeptide (TPR) repeat protein
MGLIFTFQPADKPDEPTGATPMRLSASDSLAKGLALLRDHDYAQAERALRACVFQDSGCLPAVRALAAALLALNDAKGARAVLRDYCEGQSMCAKGWILAAQLEWKLGAYDDALVLLRRGLDRLPHSPELRRQIDLLSGARGSTSAKPRTDATGSTCPDLLDRVARDVRLLEGLLNLPATREDTPMLREIESRLRRLLEAQPMHADRHLLLARLQLRLGDAASAHRSVQRALRVNPQYPQAQRLRATLLARARDHADAIRTLETLIARGLKWPDLHLQIAQSQHAIGQKDRARQHLYTALQINPAYHRARALLERCAA